MLLRDLQEYLRKRFNLLGAGAAHAAAAQSGGKNAAAAGTAHSKKQDFAPLIPWAAERRAWLAVFAEAYLTEDHPLHVPDSYVKALWIRPGIARPDQIYRLLTEDGKTIPEDGRERYFSPTATWYSLTPHHGSVSWAEPAGPFSRLLATFLPSVGESLLPGSTIYSEVWEVLDGAGDVVHDGDGNVVPNRVLDLPPITRESTHGLSLQPAERYGADLMECWSVTPYRVAGDASWLTILGPMTWDNNEPVIFDGWEYDLAAGTPAGQYDIRASVENCSGMYNGYKYTPTRYPPPNRSRVSGRWISGVWWYYLTMCYRWVPNADYDPGDPLSPPFWVHAYRWTYSDQAPSDLPINSSWTAVAPGDRTVEASATGQTIALSPGDFLYREGEEPSRVLGKGYSLWGLFRYRVPGTMRADLKGGGQSFQAAAIHLREDVLRVPGGLRTMSGENIVYDDPVVSTLLREGEEAWPSGGGIITVADLTSTMRGEPGIVGTVKARPGGDFWALVLDRSGEYVDWWGRIISRTQEIELDRESEVMYADVVRFSEADGKLWVIASED